MATYSASNYRDYDTVASPGEKVASSYPVCIMALLNTLIAMRVFTEISVRPREFSLKSPSGHASFHWNFRQATGIFSEIYIRSREFSLKFPSGHASFHWNLHQATWVFTEISVRPREFSLKSTSGHASFHWNLRQATRVFSEISVRPCKFSLKSPPGHANFHWNFRQASQVFTEISVRPCEFSLTFPSDYACRSTKRSLPSISTDILVMRVNNLFNKPFSYYFYNNSIVLLFPLEYLFKYLPWSFASSQISVTRIRMSRQSTR